MDKLLEVKNLNIDFAAKGGSVRVVSDLSFELGMREAIGIVGESGSGKSVTSLAIMRLLPSTARVTGEILFDGQNLLSLSEKEMQSLRGNRLGMIFQEPMSSLNPVHTCGEQIMESLLLHTKISKTEAREKALELLTSCGIPDAARRFREYPHQLSGGLRQRIMIAIALACDPSLLIADEPTTALDVTIQAQIIRLLADIREKKDMSIIMITHDLGIISDLCDKVVVVYAGEVVEKAPVKQLFRDPLHPYTKGLINALPRINRATDKLEAIDGMVPDADKMPEGCRFHPRCKFATERCRAEKPPLTALDDGRCSRCFFIKGTEVSPQ